jgi:glycosyltransferase involved in cell wall biosynthesis
VSEFIKDCLVARGYPAERIVKHYIGVDTAVFRPSATNSTDWPYILCVARHAEKKGIDDLLRAFSSIASLHPEVRLVLVGDGRLTGALKSLAYTLSIDHRVEFLGAQPAEIVLKLMQGARIFALFGRVGETGDAEGLGIVFNEASACGVPIVTTRVGGIPEAVIHGENGYLVAPGDISEFSKNLDRLLRDRELSRTMGERGRQIVCERFDIRKQSIELERIYRSAIDAFNIGKK